MYIIRFVQDDALRVIETISRERANQEYAERAYDPTVTELEAFILTVDIKFSKSSKVYTYFVDKDLKGYRFVTLPNGEQVQIIGTKIRSVEELRTMAMRHGFSFSDYKVLHGTAIK